MASPTRHHVADFLLTSYDWLLAEMIRDATMLENAAIELLERDGDKVRSDQHFAAASALWHLIADNATRNAKRTGRPLPPVPSTRREASSRATNSPRGKRS